MSPVSLSGKNLTGELSPLPHRELLNCNWKKRDKEKVAPNVCRLIRRTNEVRWAHCCAEILRNILLIGQMTVCLYKALVLLV